MSGIEVAGFALAVLPILIEVVKQTQAKRHDPRRAEIIEDICWEITFLRMNLENVARGLTKLPENVRNGLLSSTSARTLEVAWSTKEVAQALESRLGTAHGLFFLTLKSTLSCLEQLVDKKSLQLSNEEVILPTRTYAKLRAMSDKSDQNTEPTIGARVRFAAYEGRRYAEDLQKIKINNERIEKLISSSVNLPMLGSEAQLLTSKTCAPHLELRPLLHKLYETLRDLWPCDCHRRHVARMSLVKQCQGSTADNREGEHVHFNMLMSLGGQGVEPYCQWLESQVWIALQPHKRPAQKRGVHFGNASSAVPLRSRNPLQVLKSSYKKATTTLSGQRRASVSTRHQIKRLLCQALLEANRSKCLPGILFDGTSIWHMAGMSPLQYQQRPSRIKNNATDTSLASLLVSQQRMSLREKRILAVILAHSLLHFCESPWLGTEWSKEHISFFAKSGAFSVRHPYLSTDFQASETKDDIEAIFRIHPNSSVLALGILLLEVDLHCSIEAHRGTDDLDDDGKTTVNTDYFTALRVLKDTSDDVYQFYGQAVSACLRCDFYDPDAMEPSMNDSDFQRAVYERIVKPLETELYIGFNLTPDDLGLDCE